MREYILSPSLLAADFASLADEIHKVESSGAKYLHLDVMDGCFVPSISFGMPVIKALRKSTGLVFDTHLMVDNPDRYINDFVSCGADIITVHAEACTHLDRTLNAIKAAGVKAGVAVNPSTPLSALEYIAGIPDMILLMSVNPGFGGQKYIPYVTGKIRKLRQMLDDMGLDTDIEVDGGVTLTNAAEVMAAGANVLVAGSAVFSGDAAANTAAFISLMGSRGQQG
jgi:ribulose-phosphate 3-epimerase